MSASPDYLIAMVVDFSADTILSALLIFLWIIQRKERHALFWGAGQFSVMIGSAIWLNSEDVLSLSTRLYLCGLSLSLAIAGYWAGTQFFIGKLRPHHIRWMGPVVLVLSGLFYFLWNTNPHWLVPGSAAGLGVILCWAGQRLIGVNKRYRLLGWTLIMRGCLDLLSAASFGPEMYEQWFVFTSVFKVLSMLGLTYAVQDEIQQRYARTIDSLSHGFLIRDRRGYIHVANERCAKLLGFNSAEELIGLHVCDLLPNLTRDMADAYFRYFETEGVQYPISNTATVTLRNGSRLPVELLGSPYIERGRLFCLVQLLDISERQKKDDQLYQAARIDPITGFFNRHALSLRLTEEVEKAAAAGQECAVLCVDLGKFKRVNESFGHAAGDELLRSAARRLHRLLRPADVLARFDGDEFIVLIPGLAPGSAEAVGADCASAMIAAMGKGFELSYHAISVTASIGIACYPQHGTDSGALLHNADIAMYEARKAGRGEQRLFDDDMNAAAKDALMIDGALRGALAAGEFYLVYQAITNAHTGKLTKVEALLRWNSSLLGPVTPDRFIPVAEDCGLIEPLGAWVLHQACRQLQDWRDDGLDELMMAINISPMQFRKPGFTDTVRSALHSSGVDPRCIELEITETLLMQPLNDLDSRLRELTAMGLTFSLDDFGTGYSSLGYLKRLPISRIKLDKSFVADLPGDVEDEAVTRATLSMAKDLGLHCVAEGVETPAQRDFLSERGCDTLQGYLFARPMPEQECREWIRHHRRQQRRA